MTCSSGSSSCADGHARRVGGQSGTRDPSCLFVAEGSVYSHGEDSEEAYDRQTKDHAAPTSRLGSDDSRRIPWTLCTHSVGHESTAVVSCHTTMALS